MKEKRGTSSMPSRKKIFQHYWNKEDDDILYKNLDWYLHLDSEYDDLVSIGGMKPDDFCCCFACGFTKTLDRAHIIAVCDGGSDEVENIHILCRKCHLTTEGIVRKDDEYSRILYDSIIMNTPHYRSILENSSKIAAKRFLDENPKDKVVEYFYSKTGIKLKV